MKTGKILLAIFLLFGLTKGGLTEYNKSGNSLILIAGLIIGFGLGFLLVRSAFKAKPVGYKPNKLLKTFWIIVSVFSIMGILGAIFNPNNSKSLHVVEINGVKIPLDKCIFQTNRKTGDFTKSFEYCDCLANKFANNEDILKFEKKNLEQGRFDLIINKYSKSPIFQELGIDNCMSTEIAKAFGPSEWNENIRNNMKQGMMSNLIGSEMEPTHDISKFCDCILDSLVNYPIDMVFSGEIYQTREYFIIDSICRVETER